MSISNAFLRVVGGLLALLALLLFASAVGIETGVHLPSLLITLVVGIIFLLLGAWLVTGGKFLP